MEDFKKGDIVNYCGYGKYIVLRKARTRFGSKRIAIKAIPNGRAKEVLSSECKRIEQ